MLHPLTLYNDRVYLVYDTGKWKLGIPLLSSNPSLSRFMACPRVSILAGINGATSTFRHRSRGSFGAQLIALAVRLPHRSRLVLIAAVIANQREIVCADLAGPIQLDQPIDRPRLAINGKDQASETLSTLSRRLRLLEAHQPGLLSLP